MGDSSNQGQNFNRERIQSAIRGVDDDGVIGRAQRGVFSAAVELVPALHVGQNDDVAVGMTLLLPVEPAAAGALLGGGGDIQFEGGIGHDDGADIPADHDHPAA